MRVFIVLLAVVSATAQASCWEAAGERYGIDPVLLKAIAWKESRGWPNAVGPKLKDGNRALGLMQINTIHLPRLAEFGIRREHLFDACVSQQVGAWVLADCIARFGGAWRAVGCYYAGPASRAFQAQAEYVDDVRKFYDGYKRQQVEATPAATSVVTASMNLSHSTPVGLGSAQ